MNNHDPSLLNKMREGEKICDRPGVILLVELDKLVGIAPYAVRETKSLLYLDALAVITAYQGCRHEMPLLGMLKHISQLQKTSHIVLTVTNRNTK